MLYLCLSDTVDTVYQSNNFPEIFEIMLYFQVLRNEYFENYMVFTLSVTSVGSFTDTIDTDP